MAEKKYKLLVHPRRDSTKKIKPQPWYKERLRTKYNKPLLLKDRTSALDASAWTFVKDGMDDFRDGFPPLNNGLVLLQGQKGIKINVSGSNSFDQGLRKQRIKPRLTKEELIYSRTVPAHKKRVENVNALEHNLLSHPLALYPHIEESLPSDTFDKLVTLLDPGLTITDDIENEEKINLSTLPTCQETLKIEKNHTNTSNENEDRDSPTAAEFENVLKDPKYKGLHQTQEEISREEQTKENRRRFEAQQADNKIDQVTKEFCDWVKDLGGDTNNIEESTVNSLFASGYDTKPTLSVPIRVVELTNVPPELRADGPSPTIERQKERDMSTSQYTPRGSK
jgi:hypothetical protein